MYYDKVVLLHVEQIYSVTYYCMYYKWIIFTLLHIFDMTALSLNPIILPQIIILIKDE